MIVNANKTVYTYIYVCMGNKQMTQCLLMLLSKTGEGK